ncbi:MAG: tetratricopeptide repeat protein, partial [Anaerolineales bacterium]
MANEDVMLQEAINAAREGDRARARDLLTRLLRTNQSNPDYWFWMSAVVDTRQEQIYCLQNLLKVAPDNVAARRGLVLMGELPARDVVPVPPHRAKKWDVPEIGGETPTGLRAVLANPLLRIILFSGIGLFVVGMIMLGIFGVRGAAPPTPTPDFVATSTLIQRVTLTPSPSITPTRTPFFLTSTPTPGKPTPLVYFLEATYTPTPLSINTPH